MGPQRGDDRLQSGPKLGIGFCSELGGKLGLLIGRDQGPNRRMLRASWAALARRSRAAGRVEHHVGQASLGVGSGTSPRAVEAARLVPGWFKASGQRRLGGAQVRRPGDCGAAAAIRARSVAASRA